MKTTFFFILLFAAVLNLRANQPVKNAPVFNGGQCFIENAGQIADAEGKARPDVLYSIQLSGMTAFFTKNGVYYVLSKSDKPQVTDPACDNGVQSALENPNFDPREAARLSKPDGGKVQTYRMDVEWLRANPNVSITAEDKVTHEYTYYISLGSFRGVKAYKKITYREIYPNTDLVYYLTESGELKYDLILRPGADPAKVAFQYKGANKLREEDGKIRIETPLGDMQEQAPYTYQIAAQNAHTEVKTSYTLNGDVVSFDVANYDKSKTLVIDPITRVWATTIPRLSNSMFYSGSFELTNDGSLFYTGVTLNNVTVPASAGGGVLYVDLDERRTMVVFKYNSSGVMVNCIFYGQFTVGTLLTKSVDGNSILAFGSTGSNRIPGPNNTYIEGINAPTGFVVSFNQDLTINRVVLTKEITEINNIGSEYSEVYDFKVDSQNNLYFVGITNGNIFPTALNSFSSCSLEFKNFVVKYNSNLTGNNLEWSYYVGCSEGYTHMSVLLNNDNVLILGTTRLPFNVVDDNPSGLQNFKGVADAFVIRFNKNSSVLWGTYLGGTRADFSLGLAVNSKNEIIVYGETHSDDFPVKPSQSNCKLFKNTHSNPYSADLFLTKLSANGQNIKWSRFYGEEYQDQLGDPYHKPISVDSDDNIYVVGNSDGDNNLHILPEVLSYCEPSANTFFAEPSTSTDPFPSFANNILARFNDSGYYLWSTTYGGGDGNTLSVFTNNDDVYLIGSFDVGTLPPVTGGGILYESSGVGHNIFITKYRFEDCPTNLLTSDPNCCPIIGMPTIAAEVNSATVSWQAFPAITEEYELQYKKFDAPAFTTLPILDLDDYTTDGITITYTLPDPLDCNKQYSVRVRPVCD